MADHYQTLGLRRDATKAEVKAAFRCHALRHHPDRHAHSSDSALDAAARHFRLASEAYQVLSDDHRRADYDLRLRASTRWTSSASASSSTYGYGSGGYRRPPGGGGGGGSSGAGFDWGFLLKVVTRRGFLINVGFASVLLGGAAFIDGGIQEVWRMNNSGKSFEEAMESIEKVKIRKGNS